MKNGWLKAFIVVFFLASFILISGRNITTIINQSAPDFTQIWKSAGAMTHGKEPYLSAGLDYENGYPPVSEIFYIPFSFLNYHQALCVFTFLSFVSIVGSVFLSLKIAAKRVPWYYFLLFLGCSFITFPTKFSLGLGQINMVVLFLLLLAVYLEAKPKKNSIFSGIALSCANAHKPIFAFFLLFFALKKSWRMVFATGLSVSFFILITLLFWPFSYWVSWYKTGIMLSVNYTSPVIYAYQNQGIFSFISKYISDFNLRIYLHKALTIIVVSAASYFGIKSKDYNLALSLFIISLLLIDITSWQHHFVWLAFPFIVFFVKALKSKNAVILALLIASYGLVSWNLRYPLVHPLILWSTQFYAGVIMWGINLYFLKNDRMIPTKADKGSIRYKIFNLLGME
jgi:hypothetical protein